MVLPVVAEEVAGQHGPQVVARLGARVVGRHVLRVRAPVRQVRAEVEELQRAQQRGHHPEAEVRGCDTPRKTNTLNLTAMTPSCGSVV